LLEGSKMGSEGSSIESDESFVELLLGYLRQLV
jgi:hypothetical protein